MDVALDPLLLAVSDRAVCQGYTSLAEHQGELQAVLDVPIDVARVDLAEAQQLADAAWARLAELTGFAAWLGDPHRAPRL